MPTCSFCKKNYPIHQGLTVFNIDGKSLFYCSSKCRKNANLGRDPRKINWVRKSEDFIKNSSVKEKKLRDVQKKSENKNKDK
ncbi:MAG: 50S ribosomal protein L24 [Nanoarchaeota archaeon]